VNELRCDTCYADQEKWNAFASIFVLVLFVGLVLIFLISR